MSKLDELNKIPVVDYSCSCGELEYVFVANTENNQNELMALGATRKDLEDMGSENEDTLDITMFAVEKLGAEGWQNGYGFLTLKQAKDLNLKWANPQPLEGASI